MNCPFCTLGMEEFHFGLQGYGPCTTYSCSNTDCMFHKMPRYKTRVCYSTGEKLAEFIIMDGKFYVEVDFVHKTTQISKLDACIKQGTIHIASALNLNLENYRSALDKIKLLVIFS